MSDSQKGSWRQLADSEEVLLYVDYWTGDIVAITQPNGYDWWNIYDTTGIAVEGTSVGPYKTKSRAVSRVRKDIPEFPEYES